MSAEMSVLVPLGPDATFALLTEPERLRRWQAVTARVELRAGGEYRWTIVPGHTAAGTVTELEPGKRLVLSFGWEGAEDLPPGASTVTITLEPTEGGTRVRLVHSGLTPEQAAGHLEGWNHYGARLVNAAEKGDAGRDEWGGLDLNDPLARSRGLPGPLPADAARPPARGRRAPDALCPVQSLASSSSTSSVHLLLGPRRGRQAAWSHGSRRDRDRAEAALSRSA